ncbi:hypothetical protein ACLKA7_015690 [Drosophila subpalustris]
MKGIITLVSLIGFAQALSWEWEDFKLTHNKTYGTESEEQLRWRIFKANKEIIDRHNERYAAGQETFEMGINEFTDLLPKEFESLMLSSYNMTEDEGGLIYSPPPNVELPDTVDWRTKGAVTPVKNQGKCGSCWAFAAVATLEGQHFLRGGHLVELSEQNLLDCSTSDHGCNGGLASRALSYIRRNHGIDTARSYPYKARQQHCHFKKSYIGARVRSVAYVRRGSESALAAAVAAKGPIAVSIDASHLHHYKRGVLRKTCRKRSNHAVTVVGYGRDSRDGDYWLVKNSWGRRFGEHGYVRMARNYHNMCHIASRPLYPIV